MTPENVEEKDILQVNATMIAGAFIFLSIVLSADLSTSPLIYEGLTIAYLAIIPFSISAVTVIFGIWNQSRRRGWINISLGFMVLGFIVLAILTLSTVIPVIQGLL